MTSFKIIPVCGIFTFFLTGCAPSQNLRLGTDDACSSLQAITTDYFNGFEKTRGSGTSYPSFTLYRAKQELVQGHCEIWEWAGGDRAYVCAATTPVSEVAEQRYSVAVDFIQECVGQSWTKEVVRMERDGAYFGQATNFASSATPGLVISVQNTMPPSAYRTLYNNVLYVGAKGRRPSVD